jgi:hypothetical protein
LANVPVLPILGVGDLRAQRDQDLVIALHQGRYLTHRVVGNSRCRQSPMRSRGRLLRALLSAGWLPRKLLYFPRPLASGFWKA